MKNKVRSLLIVLIGVLTFSCSTSNDVAGKFGIQKRKYTKGISISKNKKYNLSKTSKNQEILVNNNENTNKIETVEKANTTKKVKTNIPSTHVEPAINVVETNYLSTLTPVKKTSTQSNTFTFKETIKSKAIKNIIKKKGKKSIDKIKSTPTSDDEILYYILAILIPFVAVGLVTDWDITKVLICLLLTLLCYIPGLIYALITVKDNV